MTGEGLPGDALVNNAHPVVHLATIDLSFHHAAAGVVMAVLNRHGVTVEEVRHSWVIAVQTERGTGWAWTHEL
jgi:hypothetical protein